MQITYISIFPDIYTSFLATSLIQKAQTKWIIYFDIIDPREFCDDAQHQIDDEIYGGGAGMLMKAQPMIDAVRMAIQQHVFAWASLDTNPQTELTWTVLMMAPSQTIFNQRLAYDLATYDVVIIVNGRYEGIDHRFEQYMWKHYPEHFQKISMGAYITLWGEAPSMAMTEAIVRLIPGVIKEEASHRIESYDPEHGMHNIEYPQYTRPEIVEGMWIPPVLLSGHHANIQAWRDENMGEV
jgi:tRNA (guanine37-N1)-methyltransferase